MTTSMEKIDSRLAELQPDTLRYRVLVALKQFRSSWVELGRLLNEMVYGGDYKDAGYDDFEVYCARELGLKKPTVQKLMVSYNYMKKYESGRLEAIEEAGGGGAVLVPDFQTVELLDRVRRRDEAPGEAIDDFHRRAFDATETTDETALRKELRATLKPACGSENGIDVRRRELSLIIVLGRKLRRSLSATQTVPEGLRERLGQVLTELEGLEM
jgi:hypothetical protein